jgi:hypothetical protein
MRHIEPEASSMNLFVRSTALALLALTAACAEDAAVAPTGVEDPDGVIFVVENERPGGYRDALYIGRVVIDEQGCMRLQGSEPTSVVWPFGSRLQVSRDGAVYVIDDSGVRLAKVGGDAHFGGGETSPDHAYISRRDRAILAERCPGKVWIATPSEG